MISYSTKYSGPIIKRRGCSFGGGAWTKGDCFRVTTNAEIEKTATCFSVSTFDKPCFHIKCSEFYDEEIVPMENEIDLSEYGFSKLYAIHAQSVGTLYVVGLYEDLAESYIALAKLTFILSSENGAGPVTGILDMVNIENDGITDSSQILNITGYDNYGIEDFFISYGADPCSGTAFIYDSTILTLKKQVPPQPGLMAFTSGGWLYKGILNAYTSGVCIGENEYHASLVLETACPGLSTDGISFPVYLKGWDFFNETLVDTEFPDNFSKLEAYGLGFNTVEPKGYTAMVRDDLTLGECAVAEPMDPSCYQNIHGTARFTGIVNSDTYGKFSEGQTDNTRMPYSYRTNWDGKYVASMSTGQLEILNTLENVPTKTTTFGKDYTLYKGAILKVDGTSSTIAQESIDSIT